MSKNNDNISATTNFEITSLEAWQMLQADNKACIVDVRTVAEWSFVGIPDLSSIGRELHQISWRLYPSMCINQDFAQQLLYFVKKDKQAKLLFLCRSGHRSAEAREYAVELGYKNSYNIIDGFEGKINKYAHRNNINGWRHNNLPWVQA